MILLRPTERQERWLSLAGDHGVRGIDASRTGGWRVSPLLVRAALAVLSWLAVAVGTTLLFLLRFPEPLLLAALMCLGAAEYLAVSRRVFATGIETGLAVAAVLLIGFQCVEVWRVLGERGFAWVLAVGFTLMGLRQLNALLTTLGALAASYALARASSPQVAAGACAAMAFIALAAGGIRLQRPSHDRMLDWLQVGMPLAAYGWRVSIGMWALVRTEVQAPSRVNWLVVVVLIAYAMAATLAGLRRRRAAPLWAAIAAAACLAVELHSLSPLPLNQRLVLEGGLVLALALFASRWLREERNGITSLPEEGGARSGALLDLARATALPHEAPSSPRDGFSGGGGRFGGGGAGGDY